MRFYLFNLYQYSRYRYFIVLVVLSFFTQHVWAKEFISICQSTAPINPINKAQLAAKIACDEYALWGKPFINSSGHLVQLGPMEAEKDKLTHGEPAWKRVLHYWTAGVGVNYLYHADDIASNASDSTKEAFIRTHLIDNPWSGAFISYLMKSAGMSEAEFAFNDGHIRYIKPAFAETLNIAKGEPSEYAYSARNPLRTRITTGDLLCYVREGRDVYGIQNFQDWLTVHYNDGASLKTHCDIIAGTYKNWAYSIGGNVAQSVTMRQLSLTQKGFLSPRHILTATVQHSWLVSVLGESTEAALTCDPLSGHDCDMNRKDWVVLLKAKQ